MVRFGLLALVWMASLQTPGIAPDDGAAFAALSDGRVDEAARLLHDRLVVDAHDGYAHQLLCRVNYAQDKAAAAIQECEAAVADRPTDSTSHLWLGRAYGMRASSANPILAFSLARKVVASFERAVQLDPVNVAALRDLGEYYVAAPGMVGGGIDKAKALAVRMMSVSPTKAHRLLAQIAEKNGDDATAEDEFKRAVDAQKSPESYVDLAQFYHGRKQYDRAAVAIEAAMRLDRPRDAAAVDAASILIAEDRSLPQAKRLLREYLASPGKSDAAPAFKVHVQLGEVLKRTGDAAGADSEYRAALDLAGGFAPARKAIAALNVPNQAMQPALPMGVAR